MKINHSFPSFLSRLFVIGAIIGMEINCTGGAYNTQMHLIPNFIEGENNQFKSTDADRYVPSSPSINEIIEAINRHVPSSSSINEVIEAIKKIEKEPLINIPPYCENSIGPIKGSQDCAKLGRDIANKACEIVSKVAKVISSAGSSVNTISEKIKAIQGAALALKKAGKYVNYNCICHDKIGTMVGITWATRNVLDKVIDSMETVMKEAEKALDKKQYSVCALYLDYITVPIIELSYYINNIYMYIAKVKHVNREGSKKLLDRNYSSCISSLDCITRPIKKLSSYISNVCMCRAPRVKNIEEEDYKKVENFHKMQSGFMEFTLPAYNTWLENPNKTGEDCINKGNAHIMLAGCCVCIVGKMEQLLINIA